MNFDNPNVFDNNIPYNFMYRICEAGIKFLQIAGTMPVTNLAKTNKKNMREF